MQSRLWVYTFATHHLSLQDINAQLEMWWYLGGLSWLMYGSRTRSVSGCLWGNLSLSPRACNHFHRLTSHIVFSTWRCIIQWPTPFRIRSCTCQRSRARTWIETFCWNFALLLTGTWDDRATSACHQPTSGMFVPCGVRKRWCSSDVTGMVAKIWSLSLLMACFLALQQWHEKLLKHTDKFHTCTQSVLYAWAVGFWGQLVRNVERDLFLDWVHQYCGAKRWIFYISCILLPAFTVGNTYTLTTRGGRSAVIKKRKYHSMAILLKVTFKID